MRALDIEIDENGHFNGNLYLEAHSYPLPEGLVSVGGDLYLNKYAHPLPAGLVSVGGDLYLPGYEHPIPDGLRSVGRNLYLTGYAHPLPAGFTDLGRILRVRDYAHLLPPALVARAPFVENLDLKIAEVIEQGGKLDMSNWHTCDTTHCRAGWAIHLAGEVGYALENKHGPEGAGALIYERSTGRRPNFYASNESALVDIRQRAAVA